MKYFIKTLGCKVNWLDSAQIDAALSTQGYEKVEKLEEATLGIVNTCTVTSEANRKSLSLAKSISNKTDIVWATGCSVRIDDKWSTNSDSKIQIFSNLEEVFSSLGISEQDIPYPISGSRTRLPVNIQYGCDNYCTFCITKKARGEHRNRPLAEIIDHINIGINEHDISEIVITGVNLAAWGCDNSNNSKESKLGELLEKILLQTNIKRIRLSSLGPQYLDERFIEIFSDNRICDFLHISMQSGSDSVLQQMQRGHSTNEINTVTEKIRKYRPYTSFSADVITGFPGETQSLHEETMAFIQNIGFSKLHVFPYSEREGTEAATYKSSIVPVNERKERAKEIRELGKKLRNQFIHSQINHSFSVLTEENNTGYTPNYIKVQTTQAAGSIENVILTENALAEIP